MPHNPAPRAHAVAAMALVALIVSACSAAASPSATTGPSVTAGASATPSVTAAPERIEVTLTDALRIEPGTMTVPVGVPVTFVVTNSGVLPHEFYLGDEAAQADHEAEMASGGMGHDEPEGISVDPGETKELTFTFEAAGATLAGCHVPGHYVAGMRAEITVTP